MTTDKTYFNFSVQDGTCPVGRVVSKSPSVVQAVTDKNKQPVMYKSGAKMGQPRSDVSFGVAYPKTDPEFLAMHAVMQKAAVEGYPHAANTPTFSWKITDGDSTVPNKAGKIPSQQEGFPGHFVVWFSGSEVPPCFEREGNNIKPVDATAIKTGYYVRVGGSVVHNGPGAESPGVYVNHENVLLERVGPEIATGGGLSASEAFGAPMAAGTPEAAFSAPAGLPATPAIGGIGLPTAPAVTPVPVTPAVTPGLPTQPATDFLSPTVAGAPPAPAVSGAVPAPGAPATPPPAPVKYKHGEQSYTKEQLLAAKWTESQIAALPIDDDISF